MRWLALFLAGPTLWGILFSLVYGMHGIVCAGVEGPESLGTIGRAVLILTWLLGLLLFVPLFRVLPEQGTLSPRLPRYAAWTGLVATVYTLFPVALMTSC